MSVPCEVLPASPPQAIRPGFASGRGFMRGIHVRKGMLKHKMFVLFLLLLFLGK